MRLEQYITEGAESASKMELAIVDAWNGNPKPMYPDLMPTASKLVQQMHNQGVKGARAEHYGKARGDRRPEWPSADSTPKTDLSIDNWCISLKQEGQSQLISSQKMETQGVFYAALKSPMTRDITDIINGDIDRIIEEMVQIRTNSTVTDLRAAGDADIKKYDKVNDDLAKKISNLMNTHEGFRKAVVYEAATGEMKFVPNGKGSIPAVANWIMVFGKNGDWVTLNSLANASYISKLASKTRIGVRFKSSGKDGKYSIGSALRLGHNAIKEELDKYEGQALTEGMVRNVIDMAVRKFRQVWDRILAWVRESVENLFTFLKLEPDLMIGSTSF